MSLNLGMFSTTQKSSPKKKFDIDTEKLKEYFSLEKCLKGLFQIAHKLYDLEFKESQDYPLYEESVKVYEIYRNRKVSRSFLY